MVMRWRPKKRGKNSALALRCCRNSSFTYRSPSARISAGSFKRCWRNIVRYRTVALFAITCFNLPLSLTLSLSRARSQHTSLEVYLFGLSFFAGDEELEAAGC